MEAQLLSRVPRYYEPYVNDCFANAQAAILMHMGQNPRIILADYLSFMYDEKTEYIGTNFLFRFSTSVEFTEEELNTSYEFAYSPATANYSKQVTAEKVRENSDKIFLNYYIEDDPNIAFQRLTDLVDAGEPLIAVVDLYEMPYHRAYQKEHGVHAVVVTGYNKAEGWVELFDKYALSSSDFDGRLPMDTVHAARTSDSPRHNPMVGEYRRPIRNLWMEVDISPQFKVTEERLVSVITESCARMSGQRKVLGQICGIPAMERLRKELLVKKNEPLNDHSVYLFRSYYNEFFKRIKRSRHRFRVFMQEMADLLPQPVVESVTQELDESAKRWDIIANLSLKLGISKRLMLIDDMDRHLRAIIEHEERAIDKLSQCNL